LDGDVLRELAKTFDLTTLDWREFFAMAGEVNGSGVVRGDICNDEEFEQVWALVND